MKKSLLIIAITVSSLAYASGISIQTRYGVLSNNYEDFKLKLNGNPLEIPDEDENYLINRNDIYATSTGDVILLSANTQPNCVQFRFLTLNNKGAKFTPVFGTCDYDAKISQNGDSIFVKMKNGKKVSTFTYFDGAVTLLKK